MVKFFRCEKCNFQFVASETRALDNEFKCGAVIDYITAEDPEVGQHEIVRSLGLKPIGCGGVVHEITQEEALSYESGT